MVPCRVRRHSQLAPSPGLEPDIKGSLAGNHQIRQAGSGWPLVVQIRARLYVSNVGLQPLSAVPIDLLGGTSPFPCGRIPEWVHSTYGFSPAYYFGATFR